MRSCKPVMMTWLCFKIFRSNLENMAMQLSLQICPMDMRKPVVMFLKTWSDCALGESLFDIFKVACKSSLMKFPLAT